MKACAILVFNSGSSSLKFGFYRMLSSLLDDFTEPELVTESILNVPLEKEIFQLNTLLEGEIAFTSDGYGQINIKDATNKTLLDEKLLIASQTEAVLHIIRFMAGFSTPKPQVIAHRVVHGGPNLLQHCFINDAVERELDLMSAFAPLHNQASLEIIKLSRKTFPKVPQVACFDTAFHANIPEVAKQLPIDKSLRQQGVYRYGFHGLSCESILYQLTDKQAKKLVIVHLGSGCSITAVNHCQSIDTSMGLTPSGGVMMGTRCGDLDPGILIYLLRQKHYSLEQLDYLINHQSGLLGVSGLSGDMRELHQLAVKNKDAKLAIDLFCSTVAKHIAAMATVLGGINTLVFTGGIGEHDGLVRRNICKKLAFINIKIEDKNNQSKVSKAEPYLVSHDKSNTEVLVCKSKENAQMAQITFSLIA